MKIRTVSALALFCLALAPAVALADPQQDQQACMNDAMTICGQFIPDRDRVGMCLYTNLSRISPACQEAMKRFNPGVTAATPRVAANRRPAANIHGTAKPRVAVNPRTASR